MLEELGVEYVLKAIDMIENDPQVRVRLLLLGPSLPLCAVPWTPTVSRSFREDTCR